MAEQAAEKLGVDHSRIVNHVLAPPAGTFAIDHVHTFVAFSAQHLVVGRVRGRFEDVAGTIEIADDLSASTLQVTIDMASIDTKNATRDEDLRSQHYLDVEQFPVMTYRGSGMTELPGGDWQVMGELTLHGTTKVVPLTVAYGGSLTDAYGNIRVAFTARTSITRSNFGITYELQKEAGHLLVGKDIAITMDVEAIHPA